MHPVAKLLMGSAKRPWAAAQMACLVSLALLALVLMCRRPSAELAPQVQFTVGQPNADGLSEPDFAACDLPKPCGPSHLKSNYLLDVLGFAQRSASGIGNRARPPVVVQIGVAGFAGSTRFTDVDLFNKTLGLLSPVERAAVHLVFVEPNGGYHEDMVENIAKLGVAGHQVQIIHAMVNGACENPHVVMYRFSGQAEHDFGVPLGIYSSWMAPDKTLPLRALKGYSNTAGRETQWKDKWLRFASATNQSAYVERVQIPCLTPSALLSAARARASDVAMVVIDAEGSDYQIVDRFLESEGFKPGYLQFECPDSNAIWSDSNLQVLVKKLRRHGYKVGLTHGHGRHGSDEDNCVAVPAGLR